jgi:predicted NAD/FAD-binding protein
MRIAVIGSGIAGLGSAYLLAPHAQVTLYESDTRLGGHANTAQVTCNNTTVSVDTGFMVFNPVRYPYFVSLLKQLDIPSVTTSMSFSVSVPNAVEYSSTYRGLFHLSTLTSPSFLLLLYHILRFNWHAKRFLVTPDTTRSLGDFLTEHHFPTSFKDHYLFPMLGSIWSAAAGSMNDYPAYETFRFLNNHLLLNAFNRPQWRTVQHGSARYVEALANQIVREGVSIRTNAPVTAITRTPQGVSVTSSSGTDIYDAVVCATHADTALSLIHNPTAEEQRILGAFTYSTNTTILHSDTRYMPRRTSAWASWNYHASSDAISLTYWMNSLQHIEHTCPVFVTLNPDTPPDNALTHAAYIYTHPVFNQHARKAQEQLDTIQGKDRLFFAGAHWGFGFHEDGLTSAVHAVRALGFPIRLG